ncbi:hypothetical protein D3C73_807510 [compost metagenome]
MGGQRGAPDAVLPPHDHVRHHVGVLGERSDLGAGARVQRAQQGHGGLDLGQRLLQLLGQAGHAAARQLFQWTGGDLSGQGQARGVDRQHVQLQLQAFAEAACGHTNRVEALDLVQHGQDFVFTGMDRRQQRFGDGRERLAQIAIVFQRIDQCRTDAAVAVGQVGQVKLPQQVVGQGFGFGDAFGSTAVVVVIIETTAAAATAPVQLSGRPVVATAFSVVGRGVIVAARLVAAGVLVDTGAFVAAVGPVQQWIALHRLGDFQLQLGRGHLQQLDRLLQLGRKHQLLSQRCLQPSLHACAERKGEGPAAAVTA